MSLDENNLKKLRELDQKLKELDPVLRGVVEEVLTKYPGPISVLQGFRGEEDQNKAYREGRSKLKFPQSKHNLSPSRAVDLAPYPIDWNYLPGFYHLAGFVLAVGVNMGVKIRWGGDWEGKGNLKGNRFMDLVHFEIA